MSMYYQALESYRHLNITNRILCREKENLRKDNGKLNNENNNILIRRFFPKGSDFDKLLNKRDIKYVEEWINFYPRRMFDGKCSYELFMEELEKLGCKIQL